MLFIDSLSDLIVNCEYLLYADDLKLFRSIKSPNDCLLMQADMDRLFLWSRSNLKFHVSKCSLVTYSKKHSSNIIKFNYKLGSEVLSVKSSIKDLGVLFDSKFHFADHVFSICKSAFSILGLIRRLGNIFNSIRSLRHLYCSLVRSRLEYASVVWCPHVDCLSVLVESIQKKFLRYLYFKEFGHYTAAVPYSELLRMFELVQLSSRRGLAMLVYLRRLVCGSLDDMSLLSLVGFAVPRPGSRSRQLFSPASLAPTLDLTHLSIP